MSATYSAEVGAAFDAVAEEYDEHYSTKGDRVDSAFIAWRARELYSLVAPGLFVDLGCGPGNLIPWLMLPNDAYLGVDISPRMIEVARRNYGATLGYRFALGDEHYVSRHEAAFVLGAFGPLQYTDDLPFFADGIWLSLRRGGRFLLMGRSQARPTRICGSAALTRPYSPTVVRRAFRRCHLSIYWHRILVPRWLPERMQHRMLRWERDVQFSRDDELPLGGEWMVVEGERW